MALALLRQHKRWLYVFLWVVILSFVILYIPSLDPQQRQLADDTLATVGSETIRTREFQSAYVEQIRRYQAMSQGRLDDAMIERLGIRDQVLSGLVSQKIQELEARRLGITIDDATVARAITQDPQLQNNGAFVGADTLKRYLQSQGKTLPDFEEEVRRQLQRQRLAQFVSDGVRVADAEVEAEFRRRTDLVRAEFVHVDAARFEAESQATDAEIAALFESRKEAYRLPDRRRLSYVLVDPVSLRSKVVIQGTEIEAYYRNQASEFETPEQACASHILVKVKAAGSTEGHDEAEARRRIDAALARVRRGEAFAAVAKATSEDSSASNGGSLGCFPRGQMVAEFEVAAFGLAPGAISDPVKTQFGFHVIRTENRIPAGVTPLEQARQRIQATLQDSKARQMATEQATRIAEGIAAGRTLEALAQDQGLPVQKSEPVAPGAGAAPLFDPGLLAAAFELKVGQTAKGAYPAGSGAAFFRVDEVLPSKIPELSEVRDRVRRDAMKSKARDRARGVAGRVAAAAKGSTLARAAAAEKLERRESGGLLARAQAFPGVPGSEAFETAAFALEVGVVSDPIETPTGFAVVRLVEKKTSDRAAFEAQKDSLREALAQQRKQEFFQSYMQALVDRYPVERNAQAMARLR